MLRRTRLFACESRFATTAQARPNAGHSASLNARRESARQQMFFTTVVVLLARKFINIVNFFIYLIQAPLRKVVQSVTHDSTIYYIMLGTFGGLIIPYSLYPYLQEMLDPDMRQKKEEERIRQNVQKSTDPLPFIRDKTNFRGQPMPYAVTDDTAIKLSIAPEWASMDRYRVQRGEAIAAERRRMDEWIRLEEQHRAGQFGVFAHMDKFSHIDRPRRGVPEVAWKNSDLKGPAVPLMPGRSQY